MRIVHVQTVLTEEVLEQLKKKSGEKTTKDALNRAVEHYLRCDLSTENDGWKKRIDAIVKNK